jgi:hypothetical protein
MRRPEVKVALWILGATAIVALIAFLWLRAVPSPRALPHAHAPVNARQDKSSLEIRNLVLQAVGGSPDATSELIRIYDQCSVQDDANQKTADFCSKEEDRWIQIGLQNGSPIAAQITVNELLQSRNCIDIYRAEYWFGRYRQAGAGNEMMWKSDASLIADKKRSCSW